MCASFSAKAVRRAVVSGRLRQPHRILRSHLVQIGRVHVAKFGELAFVPARALNPLAGFQRFSRAPRSFGRFRRCWSRSLRFTCVELVDPAIGVVPVAIDQSRRRRPPVQIDDLRVRAHVRANIDIRTDREKSSVDPDGHRFRDRVVRIDGQNLAVEQNNFRRWPRAAFLRHGFGRTFERRHPNQSTNKYCRQ